MKKTLQDRLFEIGPQRVYSGRHLDQIAFPVGGIGTGSVSLSGQGALRDWEIINRPNLGGKMPYTFPVIWAKAPGEEPVCRVLEGPPPPPHIGSGGGDPHANGEGFPHMDACTFRGEYPFAWMDFKSKKLPLQVTLEAWNPYIPSNPDDSGYPAAILTYTLTNRTKKTVETSLAWSVWNPVGSLGVSDNDRVFGNVEHGPGKNINTYYEGEKLRGLMLSSKKWKKSHPRYGELALLTDAKNVTVMKYWSREGWFTPRHDFWDNFSASGILPDHDYGPTPEGQSTAGALGVRVRLRPGQTKQIPFYFTWYFPNFEKYWHQADPAACGCDTTQEAKPVWKNYYATQFKSAGDAAEKLHADRKRLYTETMRFHDALFGSTLPRQVLDAVSSQMAILKTTTCLRLEDGTFYGWEGCTPGCGCCEGSCTHVWNYQQALPFLFPSLERSMRSADYRYNMRKDGSLGFRIQLPPGAPPNDFLPCADGQMGGILKAYRDWKICGDDNWLRSIWPAMKRSLEFAWKDWDPEKSGLMTGIQHNTYDIEFHGPNPMMGCFYLGALLAASEIAAYFGETEKAEEYRAVYESGRARMEADLYNGSYYIQQYDPEKAPIHQFGKGCLSDQVLGQWIASLAGLGYLLEPKRIRKTLESIFRHNWRADLSDHANAQRVYALNDEAGLLLCSWPEGGRPAVPFVYSDEVWTGIEYHVASHLIMEGRVREGLAVVKGARDRHDGIKRNPWDEFECGRHYARAMSSWGLLLALSGFSYDRGLGAIGFAPKIQPENFRCFWSLDGVWGVYRQQKNRAELEVLHGEIALTRLDLACFTGCGKVSAAVGSRKVNAVIDPHGSVLFTRTLKLNEGRKVVLKV
jgi:non-lysosomal glucosylceramidase